MRSSATSAGYLLIFLLGLLIGLAGGWAFWSNGPGAAAAPHPEKETARVDLAETVLEPPPAPAERDRAWLDRRTPERPLAAWLFGTDYSEGLPLGGTLVPPEAEAQKPWALSVKGAVNSLPEGVLIADGGKLFSVHAGRALAERIKQTNVFSVEALFKPADTDHEGPARIVSLSRDSGVRNFTLGQQKDNFIVRLRSESNSDNGNQPEISIPGLAPERVHAAVTYDGEFIRFYLNGRLLKRASGVTGDLARWDESFPLVFGNEYAAPRDWSGILRFVAFYDRVLSADQVRAAALDLPPGDDPLPAIPAPQEVAVPPAGADEDMF